tara:strand:- start:15626 stop:16429 length:804 start_codon:yes stop_codon:yes gene_type:complete
MSHTESAFAAHGIDHLSASNINLFIEDPARWVMRYLFNPPSQQKPVFWRGTAVDSAIGRMFGMLEGGGDPLSDAECGVIAMEQYLGLADYWQKEGYEVDEHETAQEAGRLEACLDTALPFYRKLGKPTAYQKQINVTLAECPVPVNGYLDLIYGEGQNAIVRDIKTTRRKPELRSSVARQLAIYAHAELATPKVDYIYVTSRTSEVVTFDVPDWQDHLRDVERAISAITRLLSYSDDPREIASLVYPDYDKWSWSKEEVLFAKTIWE